MVRGFATHRRSYGAEQTNAAVPISVSRGLSAVGIFYMEGRAMNSSQVMGLLRGRYSPPSWALLEEVRDGTGYATAGRSMDAMAFGLWPSRGLEIHGFEIKVFRNDWLRELKQPEKAESFYKFVDRWWIVAGDETVVKPDELPKTWGLLVVKGDKMRTVIEAPAKKAVPCSRLFMMAIIRRVTEAYVPKSRLNELVAEKVAVKLEAAVTNEAYGRDAMKRDLDKLLTRVREFQNKSGVTLEGWDDAEKIGEAVSLVMRHGPEAIISQYEYLAQRMTELGATIEKATADARAAVTKFDEIEAEAMHGSI